MKTKNPLSTGKFSLKLTFLVLASAAYVAFVALGVLSSSREIERTKSMVESLKADLQAQRTLLPIQASLQESKGQSLPEGIHVYERQPIGIEDLASLPKIFENLAQNTGVDLVSATPQARSLRDGRAMLRIDAFMRGEFMTFNSLLIKLIEMQFVESIESLGIEVTNTGQEMSLSVWLAIQ